jgi:glycosyltransferase involved in cell wall biosynthesis
MKVLWISNSPSLYDQGKHHYHGSGWIESLEALLASDTSIELGLAFFHGTDAEKKVINQTTYYPILKQSGMKNPLKTLYNNWRVKSIDQEYLGQFLNVIEDFKPDVIHVFGTEGFFGLVQDHTLIPVIIHLQGLINPILNSYFPTGVSKSDFWFNTAYFLDHVLGRSIPFSIKRFKYQANREAFILRNAKHVMGRTAWDQSIATFYNSCVNYYHVDEVLRPIFYEETPVKKLENGKLVILSTLSPTIYKGIDTVLKTADLLMKESLTDFEWNVVGLREDDRLVQHFEKKLKIHHKSCHVNFLGRKNADELKSLLTQSDVFVHPSYIDNSPNSVCEAQMLGLMVIACNVGGVASIIKDDETGKLIPANGVFELASLLKNYAKYKVKFDVLAESGKKTALQRHNKQRIKADVLQAYKAIQA